MEGRSRVWPGIWRARVEQLGDGHELLLCVQGECVVVRADQSPNAKQAYEEAKKVLEGLVDGSVSLVWGDTNAD